MTRRSWQALVLASSLVASSTALATDRPISAVKLVLRRSATGAERLTFVSKDPSLLFPTMGSANDPASGSPGGALIELFSVANPSGATLTASRGPAWKVRDAAHDSFRYTNHTVLPGVPVAWGVVLRQGKSISSQAHATGLVLAGSQTNVGVRITTGSLRNCALFAGATVRRDRTGLFVGRNAPASALTDCSNANLTGTTTTTSTSSTTTTSIPGVCGDGVINQSSEQCDGSDVGFCFGGCGRPGFSNACRCCADGGPGVQLVGCCNPFSYIIGFPNESGECVALRCDPPFTCTAGGPAGTNTCQADGTCCSPPGNFCEYFLYAGQQLPFTMQCCPGLVCGRTSQVPPGSQVTVCCVPDAAACTQDADCCSSHCSASGTCDPS